VTRSHTLALACALVGAALLSPTEAQAQRHRGVHSGGGRSVVVVGGFFHRPWFYDPWYGWGYPYGWYPPPYAYGGRYDDSSALRLQVEPKETEVFIDGYYAGTVDDFDGVFQRLRLEPGEHEVQLYLARHRSITQKVYLQPAATFRVRHTMQPLAAGETPDPRPNPPASPPPQTGQYDALGRRDRTERPGPPERPARDSEFGALAIRVQPGGAEVFVDGERWDGPDGSDRLIIQLAEGEHRIEVRREGFATYSSVVRVRRGETEALNVSLVRE
jgi:hypothetical protein